MSTFVYMTRCDGCGHCVDICPSDIMHIDENIRRAKNIEPNFCWECYSCVKACPNHAIDVRGYADFAPMGHSVRVRREEEKGTISWKIKFRNGTEKNFVLEVRQQRSVSLRYILQRMLICMPLLSALVRSHQVAKRKRKRKDNVKGFTILGAS